ncbi:hypothetical protein KFS98_003666 [Salmonella enterica]|nr:hypothetical protein [Salmonella enterica]
MEHPAEANVYYLLALTQTMFDTLQLKDNYAKLVNEDDFCFIKIGIDQDSMGGIHPGPQSQTLHTMRLTAMADIIALVINDRVYNISKRRGDTLTHIIGQDFEVPSEVKHLKLVNPNTLVL